MGDYYAGILYATDVLPLERLTAIQEMVDSLITERDRLVYKITEIDEAGYENGNIVEEWRGERGPYYRMTYYVDPVTGHKPANKYIPKKRLAEAQQRIANHHCREDLLKQVDDLNQTLARAQRRLAGLFDTLAHATGQLKQAELL